MNENLERGPSNFVTEGAKVVDVLPAGVAREHEQFIRELVWALSALSEDSAREVHAHVRAIIGQGRANEPPMNA